MKKIIAILCLLLMPLTASAVANQILFQKRPSDGSAGYDAYLLFAPPSNGFMMFDPSINEPRYFITGTGLNCDSATTVCSVTVNYADIASKPDLSVYATNTSVAAAVSGKQSTVTLTTTGTGAATFNSGTGALNIPTPNSATPFNYGAPTAKTVAVSTAYQAADVTKAAVVTISPSCQNATTVLASSACTLQVRQSATAGLTCSNGTVASTWTSTVQLGLVFTQTSGSPFDVKLPIGGYFILCATSGTFTLSAVEQSAG